MMDEAIDVSKWDAAKSVNGVNVWTPIDWKRARDESRVSVAIMKVSEGTVEDVAFKMQWGAANKILPRIGYHFFRGEVNAIQAAQMFLQLLMGNGFDPRYDTAALDLENKPWYMSSGVYMSAAASWLYEVEKALGKKPFIYTGYYFWYENGNPSWGGRYPLWLAQYPYDTSTAPLFDMATLRSWKVKIEAGTLKPHYPATVWSGVAMWQITARCKPSNIAGYPTGAGTKLAVDWNVLYYKPPVIGGVVNYCPTCGQALP